MSLTRHPQEVHPMVRRVLMCLPLLAAFAGAQEAAVLSADTNAALAAVRAQAAAQKPVVLDVNACWTRSPRVDELLDSAKLPVDFCVRQVSARVVGAGGTLSVVGEYTPAGASARAPIAAAPQDMSSYKSGDGSRVYSAYIFSEANAHGDTGSIWVSFTAAPDGTIDPGSVRADFGVGCPSEECEKGEEPGVRVSRADWR
jgi:hypothetical protein